MDTWIGFEPDEQQLLVMFIAFVQFEATGEWPFLQFVRLQAANAGLSKPDDAVRRLPKSYFYPRTWPLNQGDEVRLTVPALARLEQARPELDMFIRVLRMFGSRLGTFEPHPREVRLLEVTADDVRAEFPEVTDQQLAKVFSLLQSEPLGSGSGHGPDGPTDWRLSMTPDEAERLGDVSSVEEYLKVRHLFPDELPRSAVPLTLGGAIPLGDPDEQAGASDDSGSEATLESPRVFVSWAHSDARAEANILALVTELRGLGVDADVDLYHLHDPVVDWTRWGPLSVDNSDFVLVVVSQSYRERWEGTNKPTEGAGAVQEADKLKGLFQKDQAEFQRKVKLVVLPESSDDWLPDELRRLQRFRLTEISATGLEDLVRVLTGQPLYVPPKLGLVPALPPTDPAPRAHARPAKNLDEVVKQRDAILGELRGVEQELSNLPEPSVTDGPHLPWYQRRQVLESRRATLEAALEPIEAQILEQASAQSAGGSASTEQTISEGKRSARITLRPDRRAVIRLVADSYLRGANLIVELTGPLDVPVPEIVSTSFDPQAKIEWTITTRDRLMRDGRWSLRWYVDRPDQRELLFGQFLVRIPTVGGSTR